MPKVLFVNECRAVDARAGQSVREVAREAGVALDAHRFRGAVSCGGRGLCRACLCWIEESAPGAAGPRAWMERVRGLRGWRRLACRARVLGDLQVYSLPAAANRGGAPRVIADPPRPTVDATVRAKPDDAASTARFVHGHPSAIGRGERAREAPTASLRVPPASPDVARSVLADAPLPPPPP